VSRAAAHPYFQFSSGTDRCSECHHVASGGGMLTEWGRDELGGTLAMGGDGRFLHGVPLPGWLDLGGGLRLAALAEGAGAEGVRTAVFPMQIEGAVRVAGGPVSATVIVGARSAAREASDRPDDDSGGFGGLAPFSREHFVTYQPEEAGWYIRGGRFAAPFGLRIADHSAFVRRFLGFGIFEETYGVGVGALGGTRELHATAFVSDMLQWRGELAAGVAAVAEQRVGSAALLGSMRATWGELTGRAIAGVATRWWIEPARIQLMAELDGGWEQLREAGTGRPFAAAWVGPTWLPTTSVAITPALEAWFPDARIPATGRLALSPQVAVMPWAHVEIAALARLQQVGTDDRAAQILLQLHYLP